MKSTSTDIEENCPKKRNNCKDHGKKERQEH
jgi:hypothetical protein